MGTIYQKPEIPNIFLINEIQFKEERDKLYKKHQKEKRGSIFIYGKNGVGQPQVLKIRTYLCLETSDNILYTICTHASIDGAWESTCFKKLTAF